VKAENVLFCVATVLAFATGSHAEDGPMKLPSSEEIALLPAGGGPEFNRLVFERSPYLLQHARNPVDWHPWGAEALERARLEDKPIFLSVGYSTCHWCHVMERESFENESVAELMNERYVSVKVDREERPDIDGIYMKATQLMTGRGGWPNSLWLTPDGRPWFAGTYFPPEDSGGRAGFRSILTGLADAWRDRRDEVEQQADRFAAAMAELSEVGEPGQIDRVLVDRAFENLRMSYDGSRGGFGSAPKFPPHGSLGLLFAEYEREGDPDLLDMATRTLDAMIAGGIHDMLGGGFHRYSTDARWFLPHFEKMLYDNAQLLGVLADAHRLTHDDGYRRAAEGIVEWLEREMLDAAGGFYSALDADSEGEEGKFYLWSRAELLEALGEDGEWFADLAGATPEGNYAEEAGGRRTGTNILHLPGGAPEDLERFDAARSTLLRLREKRVRPHLDDKVLASWNALMISGLVKASRTFGRNDWLALAENNADFLLNEMRRGGRLLRSWRAGSAELPAYLDDYAFLAFALLDLHEATGDARWLRESLALSETMLADFEDEGGGFYFTADGHEDLLIRSMDAYDHALPSGNGAAARLLLRLSAITRESRWRSRGEACMRRFAVQMGQSPRGTESLLLATMEHLAVERAEAAEGWRRSGPLRARLDASEGRFTLSVALDAGWHINSTSPRQETLHPSSLSTPGGEPLLAEWPEEVELRPAFSEEAIRVYSGEFEILGKIAGEIPALILHFQACDDARCLSPEKLELRF